MRYSSINISLILYSLHRLLNTYNTVEYHCKRRFAFLPVDTKFNRMIWLRFYYEKSKITIFEVLDSLFFKKKCII
jgi:hypothetical protein